MVGAAVLLLAAVLRCSLADAPAAMLHTECALLKDVRSGYTAPHHVTSPQEATLYCWHRCSHRCIHKLWVLQQGWPNMQAAATAYFCHNCRSCKSYASICTFCQKPPTTPVDNADWDATCVNVPIGGNCSAHCHAPDFVGSPEPAATCMRNAALAAAVWSEPKGRCQKMQPVTTCHGSPPHARQNSSITYAWQHGCKDMPLAGMCNGTAMCHNQGSSLEPALATCTGAGWVLEDACSPIYLGCFHDDPYRRLQSLTFGGMPIAACKEAAINEGLTLYAMQWSVQCFGGTDLQFATSLGRFEFEGGCTMLCGVGTDMCGGGWTNSLYSAVPVGLVCEGAPAKKQSLAHAVWPNCAGLTPLGAACKGECDAGYYAVDLVARCVLDNVTTTYIVSGSCQRYSAADCPSIPSTTDTWFNCIKGAFDGQVCSGACRGGLAGNVSAVCKAGQYTIQRGSCVSAYIGCYRDDWSRRLPWGLGGDRNGNITTDCKQQAMNAGFTYYGTDLEESIFCYGGWDLARAKSYGEVEGCCHPCSPGDESMMCGQGDPLCFALYSVHDPA